jgi:hypothetical protein
LPLANNLTDDPSKTLILSRAELVIQTVLLTAIILGNVWRFCWPFVHNPMDFLFSDAARHFDNAFRVGGEDLTSILNAPGYQIYLQTIVRIAYKDHTLIALTAGLLSVSNPYVWYRWMRELTRDKTISLLGWALITYLPSWSHIYGFFMDTTLLLPLTGAGLWLTWRAQRKGTWSACLLAACVCGAACCTKASAIPLVVPPWFWLGYTMAPRVGKIEAAKMAAVCLIIVGCFYGLGPLKVFTRTGAVVLLPDGLYNKLYFESGAHDIMVTSWYTRDGGIFAQTNGWGSTSESYPPFHPFSEWKSSRKGRFAMTLDYTHGRDYAVPIKMSVRDRLRFTFENIVFFFFQYQWPEDGNWDAPFPLNLDTMVRFIWLPIFIFMLFVMARAGKRQAFVNILFLIVSFVYMFQQTAVTEGRYKKLWDGFALLCVLNVVANSKRYQRWREVQKQEVLAASGSQTGRELNSSAPSNDNGNDHTVEAEPTQEPKADPIS